MLYEMKIFTINAFTLEGYNETKLKWNEMKRTKEKWNRINRNMLWTLRYKTFWISSIHSKYISIYSQFEHPTIHHSSYTYQNSNAEIPKFIECSMFSETLRTFSQFKHVHNPHNANNNNNVRWSKIFSLLYQVCKQCIQYCSLFTDSQPCVYQIDISRIEWIFWLDEKEFFMGLLFA